MTALAIETNDSGIAVARGQALVLESPGYAWLTGKKLLVGRKAAQRARLEPSQVNNRFWEELSTRPLPRPMGMARNHADLVYAHLAHIWAKVKDDAGTVIFVVPGSYSRSQLELLLGIAHELAIPVRALVDSAVAGSEPAPGDDTLLHLDMHLHRTVLTRLDPRHGLSRTHVEVSPGTGLSGLRAACAKAIARLFVRTTRFDPLHSGATEQMLYDRLPEVLETLQTQAAVDFVMGGVEHTYTVTLSRAHLRDALAGIYGQILELVAPHQTGNGHVALQVSHRVAGFPGLLDTLASLGDIEIVELKPGANALGAMRHSSVLLQPAEALSLVTQLPENNAPSASPARDLFSTPRQPPSSPLMPTHLLYRGVAYPIGSEPFVLGRELAEGVSGIQLTSGSAGISRRHCSVFVLEGQLVLKDHSTYGTLVNQQKVSGTKVLQVGDRIQVGTPGEQFQAIALAKP